MRFAVVALVTVLVASGCSPGNNGFNDASDVRADLNDIVADLGNTDTPTPVDTAPDTGGRCAHNTDCPAGMVCSAAACVPAGFGFVVTTRDGATNGDAAIPDGAVSEWPVINGSERRGRRSVVPGQLASPVARWRFDTGQALSAMQVALVDVDGDHVTDVVTFEGGRLRARHQDGTELWRTAFLASYAVINAVHDLDGDGSPEIVLAASPPRLLVVHGASGAIAGDQNDFATGNVQAYSVPDLSGDGNPDVVTIAKNLDTPQVLSIRAFRLAASGLAMLWQYQEPNGYYGMPVLATGDVNGDGQIDITVHEYLNGWFKSFDRSGNLIVSGGGPRSGNGLYLRDTDGVPSTLEIVNAMDRNGVQADGHELGVYARTGTSWNNVWRQYALDAPPSQPILRAPWSDVALDFDGDGRVELLMGVYDYDASAGHARWSTTIHASSNGMQLAALADAVPEAVVLAGAHPGILVMSSPTSVPPPLGTTSLLHWDGSALSMAWSRTDAAPAPISTRVDVVGDTAPFNQYASHGGIADVDGDGVAEVLLFARGAASEFGDRPGQLLAVSAADGHTMAAYDVAPEDLIEVLYVEGAGDTLRVWISSHQLGLLALDRHFTVVRRLAGSGFSPAALVIAEGTTPHLFVQDASDVTHVLQADRTSANLVETSRLNHLTFVLGTAHGAGLATVLVQDRNMNANVFSALVEQPTGSFLTAWSTPLAAAENVNVVSRGSFGSPGATGYLLQIRNEVDLPSSRFIALRETDGSMLWSRTAAPPRPYVRNTLLASAVVSCGGSDHVFECTPGCACSLVAGADGTQTSVGGIAGCDALAVAAGTTDSSGNTTITVGGGAYDTDLLSVHADCTFSFPQLFPSALQSVPAYVDANGDATLDFAYWSDQGCLMARNGASGAVLWSHMYFGGTFATCDPRAVAQRFQPTAAVAGDVDGDGHDELVFGSADGDLFAVTAATGDLVFRVAMAHQLREPILADVDGDSRPEIIVGADDGQLYVFGGM
jgi:hypothetical protein